jgi:hypothetical protein
VGRAEGRGRTDEVHGGNHDSGKDREGDEHAGKEHEDNEHSAKKRASQEAEAEASIHRAGDSCFEEASGKKLEEEIRSQGAQLARCHPDWNRLLSKTSSGGAVRVLAVTPAEAGAQAPSSRPHFARL